MSENYEIESSADVRRRRLGKPPIKSHSERVAEEVNRHGNAMSQTTGLKRFNERYPGLGSSR